MVLSIVHDLGHYRTTCWSLTLQTTKPFSDLLAYWCIRLLQARVAELAFSPSMYLWFQLFLNNIRGRYCNSPKEDDDYLIYFVKHERNIMILKQISNNLNGVMKTAICEKFYMELFFILQFFLLLKLFYMTFISYFISLYLLSQILKCPLKYLFLFVYCFYAFVWFYKRVV